MMLISPVMLKKGNVHSQLYELMCVCSKVTPEDMQDLNEYANQIIKEKQPFERLPIPRNVALQMFAVCSSYLLLQNSLYLLRSCCVLFLYSTILTKWRSFPKSLKMRRYLCTNVAHSLISAVAPTLQILL